MEVLLVSATSNEIAPSADWLKNRQVEVLITGVGVTAATYALTKTLTGKRPGFVLQAGIGGSFSERYPPGAVVCISDEVIADLGAIEQGGFTDIFDMGFAAGDAPPFANRLLSNPEKHSYHFGLDLVRGATVNGISSTPEQVAMVKQKYDPIIESMEGAALHYVCILENIPFLQLRAVSNFVGERNKANWKFREAISNLNDKIRTVVQALQTND